MNLSPGVYESLLHEELQQFLEQNPELRAVFGKLDPEEEPSRYAAFIGRLIESALRLQTDSVERIALCNRLITELAKVPDGIFIGQQQLVKAVKPLLLEITPSAYAKPGLPRPESTFVESSLFTGSPTDPRLIHELLQELASTDSVDILVSFIKWSGLKLLMGGLEDLVQRGME